MAESIIPKHRDIDLFLFILQILSRNVLRIIITLIAKKGVVNAVIIKKEIWFGSAWSFGFFHHPPERPMTSDFECFSIPDCIHHIYFPILILEKEPVFSLFECLVLNKGTTGTIFITSLVWRSPWLGIEYGTSRPRSQHSTTRLSRRRFLIYDLNQQTTYPLCISLVDKLIISTCSLLFLFQPFM